MSISLMDLKISQFLFMKDLNGNSETAKKSCFKFFQYLGTGNWQSWKVTSFTVFHLFGKKTAGGVKSPLPTTTTTTTQIRVKEFFVAM